MRASRVTGSVTPAPEPQKERPLPTHGGEYERTDQGDVPINGTEGRPPEPEPPPQEG
jgi:hypothetical protein